MLHYGNFLHKRAKVIQVSLVFTYEAIAMAEVHLSKEKIGRLVIGNDHFIISDRFSWECFANISWFALNLGRINSNAKYSIWAKRIDIQTTLF